MNLKRIKSKRVKDSETTIDYSALSERIKTIEDFFYDNMGDFISLWGLPYPDEAQKLIKENLKMVENGLMNARVACKRLVEGYYK